jgi:hypothetical protein
MAKRRSKKLSDQLRVAIDGSGRTRYRIAQDTGIDQSSLAKFYNGLQTLSMENVDKLGEYLNLGLTMGNKPVNKKRS